MPGKSSKSQRNLAEQIDELRRKKLLLEGEQKAYYEGVEYSRKQLDEQVSQLQVENSDLRKLVADKLAADEYVVSKGLEGNETERKALRNKPGRVAIVLMDEKVRDRVNVLNSLQYTTRKKEERLKELETQQQKMNGDSSDSNANSVNESEDAQKLRNLENRLDKANLKCKEADHIQKTYLQIKSKLEDEHKTFENTLDEMEQDIRRLKFQLKELHVMHNDAIIRRDKAKADLEREEKEIYADRKQRELEIQKVRKEAEEKKVQAQLIQRRIDARASMAQDDLTAEQRHQLGLVEEDHEKIKTYEEAFRRIKDATGVSDTKEVVLRFENQGETQHHLEQLKEDNEEEIKKLTDQKMKLQGDYEQMKYSGEAKLSSGQHLLEEYEQHLADEEQRHDESQAKLEKRSKMFGDVKSGVEHLAEKLRTLKMPPSDVLKTKVAPESDEYVLDQLCICEEKLMKLIEDLDGMGKNVNEVSQMMDEEEFQTTTQIKLPAYNTRVKLPAVAKDTIYDDEDASGEDEEILTRQSLKKQSQQIVDTKTRRRPVKRKKKTTTK